MINIYWNMAHDGNVNHLEEIPCLRLIQSLFDICGELI